MVVRECELTVMSAEVKQNKQGNPYVLIKFWNTESGEVFDLASKELILANQVKPKHRYLVDISFINKGKFGWQPSISHVGECLGSM